MKCLIFCLVVPFLVIGQNTGLGEKYYQDGDWDRAISTWEEIISKDNKGADLYYNLANAYFKKGNYAESILNYNKALKWDPNHKQALFNLKVAQSAGGIQNIELPTFFLLEWYRKMAFSVSSFIWIVIAIAIAFFIYLLRKKFAQQNIWMKYILSSLLILIFSFFIYQENYKADRHNFILMKNYTLHLSPDENSEVKLELKAGEMIRRKDKIGSWIKVLTMEYETGWIPEEQLKQISL